MTAFVIVGGGQAGMQVADSLRRDEYDGDLVLLAEEPHFPYQRPPLSKKFLTGEFPEERLLLRAPKYFEERGIDVRTSSRVAAIHPAEREVLLADGSAIGYDRLALCTGTAVNRLPVAGADLARVHYLRTLEDTAAISLDAQDAQTIVIIGGGFIGLEVAASLRKLGKSVVVIEAQGRLMERAVSPPVSEFYASLHRDHGVDVRLASQVESIDADASERAVGAVRLLGGEAIAADMVVVGIGVHPNIELAREAGLDCDNGVVVDEYARTSDENIVAAGDCTRFPSPWCEVPIRLESVQNAMDQARVAAATMLGELTLYDAVPWFWSDQYDKKLQMVGLAAGHVRSVIRGDDAAGTFSVFYYDAADKLLAIDSINDPATHMVGRKALTNSIRIPPESAMNPQADLRKMLG